jgi:hypothetical protein
MICYGEITMGPQWSTRRMILTVVAISLAAWAIFAWAVFG